jgi:phospholipid/cholesterol/gamma-HCH transport system substrate-binding protein
VITRKLVVQLSVFLLIALVGTGYLGARYVGLDRVLGAGGYRVDVQLADAGGIFPNAEVTYRGVAVGTVNRLRLTPSGVVAQLYLEQDSPKVPADTRAVVANRSAIGEQTIDLRPDRADGPYLVDGSVIPLARTALPPAPARVLTDVDRLLGTVSTESLRTVVDELGTALAGAGPSVGQLIDGTSAFSQTATQHLPTTLSLLRTAPPVLHTQQAESQDLRTFSRGLWQLADQLGRSNRDLRTVLRDGPDTTEQLNRLVDRAGPPLSRVLDNSVPITRILADRGDALSQLLVAYPIIESRNHTLVTPDFQGRLAFVLPFYDPMPCTKGYLPLAQQRGADDLSPTRADLTRLRCAEPKGSPIEVRGSGNAPRPGR